MSPQPNDVQHGTCNAAGTRQKLAENDEK